MWDTGKEVKYDDIIYERDLLGKFCSILTYNYYLWDATV